MMIRPWHNLVVGLLWVAAWGATVLVLWDHDEYDLVWVVMVLIGVVCFAKMFKYFSLYDTERKRRNQPPL